MDLHESPITPTVHSLAWTVPEVHAGPAKQQLYACFCESDHVRRGCRSGRNFSLGLLIDSASCSPVPILDSSIVDIRLPRGGLARNALAQPAIQRNSSSVLICMVLAASIV
jgi:hypothetical protein